MRKKILLLTCLALIGVGGVQAQSILDMMKIGKEAAKRAMKKLPEEGYKTPLPKDLDKELEFDAEDVDDFTRSTNDANRETQKLLRKTYEENGIDISHVEDGIMNVKYDSVGVYYPKDGVMNEMEYSVRTGEDSESYLVYAKGYCKIDGLTSKNQFQGKAAFRVYFTHKPNSISEKYSMFSSDIKMEDFYVIDLKPDKGDKWRVYVEGTAHTTLTGKKVELAKPSKKVSMNVVKVGEEVYDVTVEGEPGEYAMVWKNKKTKLLDTSVFDFTIK